MALFVLVGLIVPVCGQREVPATENEKAQLRSIVGSMIWFGVRGLEAGPRILGGLSASPSSRTRWMPMDGFAMP